MIGPRVPAVHLVEIEPVGLQALERGLDLLHDPASRVARLIGILAHRAVELRREHDVLAPPAAQGLADDLLGLPARVHVVGVDEVDPGIQCTVDDADARVVVGLAPGAEHHGAEAERTHADAGTTEGSLIHISHVTAAATASNRATRADRHVGSGSMAGLERTHA